MRKPDGAGIRFSANTSSREPNTFSSRIGRGKPSGSVTSNGSPLNEHMEISGVDRIFDAILSLGDLSIKMTMPTKNWIFSLLLLGALSAHGQTPAPPSGSSSGINLSEAVRSAQAEGPAAPATTPEKISPVETTATPRPAGTEVPPPPAPAVSDQARFVSVPSAPVPEATDRMPSPLKFEKMKLGNVARVLSARLNVPVTIEAKADALVTGDYSHMDLRRSLSDAAAQAGLVVVALGRDGLDGYTLMTPSAISKRDRNPRGAVDAVMLVARPAADPEDIRAFLLDAAKRRAFLLKQRQTLLEAELRLMR